VKCSVWCNTYWSVLVMYSSGAGLRVGSTRQLPGAPAYKGHWGVNWNIWKCDCRKPRFLHVKSMSPKIICSCGHLRPNRFAIPVLGQSSLKIFLWRAETKGTQFWICFRLQVEWEMQESTRVCLSEIVSVPKLRWGHTSQPLQKVSFLPVLPEVEGGR
jgi:hypothetical protein